jgi:hypothetical protein
VVFVLAEIKYQLCAYEHVVREKSYNICIPINAVPIQYYTLV